MKSDWTTSRHVVTLSCVLNICLCVCHHFKESGECVSLLLEERSLGVYMISAMSVCARLCFVWEGSDKSGHDFESTSTAEDLTFTVKSLISLTHTSPGNNRWNCSLRQQVLGADRIEATNHYNWVVIPISAPLKICTSQDCNASFPAPSFSCLFPHLLIIRHLVFWPIMSQTNRNGPSGSDKLQGSSFFLPVPFSLFC